MLQRGVRCIHAVLQTTPKLLAAKAMPFTGHCPLAWQFGQSSGEQLLSALQLFAVAGGRVADGFASVAAGRLRVSFSFHRE